MRRRAEGKKNATYNLLLVLLYLEREGKAIETIGLYGLRKSSYKGETDVRETLREKALSVQTGERKTVSFATAKNY